MRISGEVGSEADIACEGYGGIPEVRVLIWSKSKSDHRSGKAEGYSIDDQASESKKC